MSWSDAVDTAMDVWYSDEYRDAAITYNGETINAHIHYGGKNTSGVARTAVIDVKVSDVALPDYRDTIIFGGNTWKVNRDRMQEPVTDGNGYFWKIPIKRDERPNFT